MGEALFINVFYRSEDFDSGDPVVLPICTIVRTCDCQDAYDAALAFTDQALIVNGAYAGMPAHEFNGAGMFAKALLAHINEGWEQYTHLGCTPDADGDGDWGDEDLVLNIMCEEEGKPQHNIYSVN